MPFFEDVSQFHTVLRRVFEEVETQNPRAPEALLRARLLIRLKCTAPTTDIWLNGRRRPLTTHFGHARLHPDLELTLEADTLHQILLGELSLTKGLASGRLEVRGALWKAKGLADLFYQSQSVYPEILREEGLLPA